MSAEITITDDRKVWDRVRGDLGELEGLAAYSGLHDERNATLGHRHEFGEGVPRRPWLTPAADGAAGELEAVAATEIGAVIDGRSSPEAATTAMGDVISSAASAYIKGAKVGGPIKRAINWIRSGDPRKLIDSGEMVGAIKTIRSDQGAEE
jgi:hypothetical protein